MQPQHPLCAVATALWDDLIASSHLDDPSRPALRLEEYAHGYRLRAESPALRAEDVVVEEHLSAATPKCGMYFFNLTFCSKLLHIFTNFTFCLQE